MEKYRQLNEAYNILLNYNGNNPYIIYLKNSILVYKNITLNSFYKEIILSNYNFEPKLINRVITFTDWFGEIKKEDWKLDFIPNKFKVLYLFGETSTHYIVNGVYRRSQTKPILAILPKKGVLTALNIESYKDKEIDFEKYDKISKNPNIKIKDFQKIAVQFLTTRKKAILADSQGYGKTFEAIISALESGAKKILVICPASLKTNWKRELHNYVDEEEIEIVNGKKWKESKFTIINFDILDNFYTLPEEIEYETIKEVNDSGEIVSKKQIKWKTKPIYDDFGNIVKEGVPKMKISRNKSIIEKAMNESQLFSSKFDLVIIDEVHKLCNSTSGRYKVINDFLKRSNPEYIFLMSGTPISNRPYNFYNVLKLIDSDVTKDWEYYVKRYCEGQVIYLKGEKYKWTQVFLKKVGKSSWYDLDKEEKERLDTFLLRNARHIWKTDGASHLDELKERTKHIYLRRLTCDIKNMVKKNVEVLKYDLDEKQTDKYNNFWMDYLNSKNIEDALEKDQYRKVIEGTLLRQFLADEMIPYTIELAENILEESNKLIIMCTFDEEIEKLKAHFGDKAVIYNGKMGIKQKDKAENAFKTDDKVKVFIGNVIAAGVGLNLQVAHDLIFNSFDWVSGSNLQSEDRIYRQTQSEDCTIYYQVFNNTFSEEMYDKVLNKERTISEVIKKEKDK